MRVIASLLLVVAAVTAVVIITWWLANERMVLEREREAVLDAKRAAPRAAPAPTAPTAPDVGVPPGENPCGLTRDDEIEFFTEPTLETTTKTTVTAGKPEDEQVDTSVVTRFRIGKVNSGSCKGRVVFADQTLSSPNAPCKSADEARLEFVVDGFPHAPLHHLPVFNPTPVLELAEREERYFIPVGHRIGEISAWTYFDHNQEFWTHAVGSDSPIPGNFHVEPRPGGFAFLYEPAPRQVRVTIENQQVYCADGVMPAANELVAAGTVDVFGTATPVSKLRDPQGATSRALYDALFKKYDVAEHAPTFEQFKSVPTYFYRDWNGPRMCGGAVDARPYLAEPLVYAYATQPTDVEIRFGAEIDLSVVKPPLVDGAWTARVDPSGITHVNGVENCCPLFWEGRSTTLSPPTRGLVIARSELGDVLARELRVRGLIDREIDDFLAYWVPKLSDAPYSLVRFVPQQEIDAMAPLLITPRPDTLIRVHIDSVPLDEPIDVEPEPADAPAPRRGLTLVEWSGFVR